jgi:hypothetical protein
MEMEDGAGRAWGQSIAFSSEVGIGSCEEHERRRHDPSRWSFARKKPEKIHATIAQLAISHLLNSIALVNHWTTICPFLSGTTALNR